MSPSRPTGSSHPSIMMGGLSVVGGVIGFLKSGSKPSLFGGGAVGALYACSAYLINQNNDIGYDLGYLSSIILLAKLAPGQFGKMTIRGGISAAALVVGAYNGFKSFESKGFL